MANITFTIPNDKLDRVTSALLVVFPNTELHPDPTWVDPGDGSEAPLVLKYTDNQWLKERVRRFIINTVHRGEYVEAMRAAELTLLPVDDLAS